uniref:ribonuclease H n=1 Tax=Diabrotica virgifera virgifera TaxID=50390 RepID=A0A6P7GCZ0_DIAVI
MPSYSDLPTLTNLIFKSILNKLGKNLTVIYTDGSKTDESTGFAFFVSNNNYAEKYRIPDCCSIFTAEAAAIQKALTWCASNYCENVVVVSDSQAVLQAICSHPLDNFQNSSILDIKKTLHNLKSTKKTVTLLWVKGHSGVVGNEIVDGMAKNTSEIPEITNIFNFKDLFSIIRSVGRERWRSKYEDVQQTSRNHYFSIHPLLPKCIPHFNYNYNKVHSSLITRLKLNHGLFPEHLHRIGIYETPFCSCNHESVYRGSEPCIL